eukprot:Trichotokara_eunicae@DN3452_c0_g1_i1.p1
MIFLENATKSCLLRENELLRSLTKILSVCHLFGRHSLKLTLYGVTDVDDVSFDRLRRKRPTLEERTQRLKASTDHFKRLVTDKRLTGILFQFAEAFDKNFRQFLTLVVHYSRKKHERHVLNLLTRLDFNFYFSNRFNMKELANSAKPAGLLRSESIDSSRLVERYDEREAPPPQLLRGKTTLGS